MDNDGSAKYLNNASLAANLLMQMEFERHA